MQSHARTGRLEAAAAHPLVELLECPPETGILLNGSTACIEFDPGSVVFRESECCLGLYVVVSGRFLRKTARMQTNMTLGPVRPGDMVELAAVLGDGTHTYTLTAQSSGSVLRISIDALREVFNQYAPLRMRLLEELAREVSRAYIASCLSRGTHARRKAQPAAKS